jgi:S-adenosylmethionine:tRNA ribosyltransferase-isomerase
MLCQDFQFDLPERLVAQRPLAKRSASRLMVVPNSDAPVGDLRFSDLPQVLQPGDLLVFNDTRVLKARLLARKSGTGGAVEILIERLLGDSKCLAQIGSNKPVRVGTKLTTARGRPLGVEAEASGFKTLVSLSETPMFRILAEEGQVPLPPYIKRKAEEDDQDRYQTVFARVPGAVAAPTAGLHFDQALFARLGSRGIDSVFVTLHVGAGTFQPLRGERIECHRMHKEWMSVSQQVIDAIQRTRHAGGRVVAVGTTVARALESAAQSGALAAREGETGIFITPGYRFRVVDLLVTNFHLPRSTLLVMVSAFAGTRRVLDAYRHAVNEGYRFYSYGDAMLLKKAET